MPLIISKTYEVITPESAEHGDAEERGFIFESEPHTFRELVDLLQRLGACSPSSWPVRCGDHFWVSTIDPERDYRTGADTYYSVHLDRANSPRAAKYWYKACKRAGALR